MLPTSLTIKFISHEKFYSLVFLILVAEFNDAHTDDKQTNITPYSGAA
jgi:hypothetical protein